MGYCQCKDCKRARREGKRLGARVIHYFTRGGPDRYSDYIRIPKLNKGRRPVEPFNKRDV